MKKLTLLICGVAGIGLAACNGGGSSSSGGSGGGGSGDACSNGASSCGTPINQVPESYSQVITPATMSGRTLTTSVVNGTLKSTTNLYLSSTESYPLSFTVTGNTTEITVNFSIVADDPNIPAGSALPSITPRQCVFAVSNPASCDLVITLGNAPVGQYKIVPRVVGGAEFSTAVVMNFLPPTQFTLPLGTYLDSGQRVSFTLDCPEGSAMCSIRSCGVVDLGLSGDKTREVYEIQTANGVYFCQRQPLDSFCSKNPPQDFILGTQTVALPAFTETNPYKYNSEIPATQRYYSNAGWNGTAFTATETLGYSACNGVFATSTRTFISSSTTPMFPVRE